MKSLTRFAWQFAASPRQALRAHCDGLPPSLRVCTATVLLVFGLTALLLFTASCAHTMQGLSREQALYRAGTNVVGQAQSLAPYLPAPVGNTVEIFSETGQAVVIAEQEPDLAARANHGV
jgi:hypothetical protein